jgi:hypothetical protein
MLDENGVFDVVKVEEHVLRALRSLAETSFEEDAVRLAIQGVVKKANEKACHSRQIGQREREARRLGLGARGLIPLCEVGERGKEWVFFQGRRGSISERAEEYILVHREAQLEVMREVRRELLGERDDPAAVFGIFARPKSLPSVLRKMREKGLACWELGDYFAVTVCCAELRSLMTMAKLVDQKFEGRILYKQSGFLTVRGRGRRRGVTNRVFYVVKQGEIVCFEMQVVTLRQLVFLQVDHPRYVGERFSLRQVESLRRLGDAAYLCDLVEFIGGGEGPL